MVRTLFVVCLALVSSSARADKLPPPHEPTPGERVLALVNRYRATAGVGAVTLDAKASQGCMEHANYMLQNRGTNAMAGLNAHKQDPSLPGATAAGAACGRAADLFPGVSDLDAAVAGWMAGLYHRRPVLAPTLARVGVGFAPLPDGTLMAALMFLDDPTTKDGWPVAYPAKAQTDVPLEFGNEIPNPVPGGKGGGYPITLQYPPFDKVTAVRATLVDAAKQAVPIYLSTPEHPATSFGQYGVIAVIPKQRLRAGALYTVAITATWGDRAAETRTWSFSTVGLVQIDATDEAALLGALGKPSLVHGTVLHGGMMDTEHAFLQIGNRTNPHVTMVSVIVPRSVWTQLSSDEPDAWTGRAVEVEASPQLVAGKYLNLAIADAAQLRAIRSR